MAVFPVILRSQNHPKMAIFLICDKLDICSIISNLKNINTIQTKNLDYALILILRVKTDLIYEIQTH